MPVSFHVISVRPLLLKTWAMLTRLTPWSRLVIRLESQSMPELRLSACDDLLRDDARGRQA